MSKNTIDMKKILLFVSIILCFSAIVSGCKNRTREIEMNKHEYTAHQTEIPMDTAKPHGRDIIAAWSGESIESMYEVHGLLYGIIHKQTISGRIQQNKYNKLRQYP